MNTWQTTFPRIKRPQAAPSAEPDRAWDRAAFTLIEVLLAISIFSIVLVAIHMVFYGALRLRNTTTQNIERGLPLQQALSIIKRDLENIVLPSTGFFGELQTSVNTSTSTNVLDLLSPVADSVIGQSSPAFFTTVGIIQDNLPWGEVERVSYFLAAPTNNTPGKDLIRSVTRNLLPTVQEVPENQWLMSGLQSIAFLYYDGLQWRDYWDSTTETNKLPRGIKVQLQLFSNEPNAQKQSQVELVVPLMLLPPTNQTSQTTGGTQ